MWFYQFWAFSAIWKGYGADPLRPTENAAFRNIYNDALYAAYLRFLNHGIMG
jgi:hypothetical protein